MPTSLKFLRRRPPDWRSENLGKNLQNDLGSLPSRSTGFARPGCPVGAAGPNVGVLPGGRNVSKSLQSNQTKQNRRGHNNLSTNIYGNANMSRIVTSGGFQLRHVLVTFGGGSAQIQLFRQSETLYRGRETARV